MARYRPRGLGLERVLGVGALFATAYGNVGSSIYYALGVVAVFALGLTPLAYLIAGAIFVMTAMTYTEATANFPEAGGSSSFARRAFNEFVSFFAAWGQMLNYVITIAISAFFVPSYLSLFWEPLGEAPGNVIAGICIVLALVVINFVGAKESARLNIVLAIFDFATQLFVMVLGFVLVFNFATLIDNVRWGVAPEWSDLALGIALAMISYTGIETISNLAEEARSPRRLIPRAMRYVVFAVLIISAGVPAVALSAMPVTPSDGGYTTDLATTYAANPVLGIVQNMELGVFAGFMETYVAVIAATILLIATNAGIIGVSRLTYSMGQYQQLPDRLRRISPRSRTPTTAIIVFGLVACIVIIPGEAEFLGTMYAFGAMLSFTVGHVSLIGLRWRVAHNRMREIPGDVRVEEGEDEWYHAPFNLRTKRLSVPLFAVLGGLGTLAAWIAVMVLYPQALVAGWLWLLAGITTYVFYRRHRGLSLTATTKVVLPPMAGVQPVEYAGVMVAFEEGAYSEEAMATALKLSAHKRSNVRVIVTLTVPQHLAIDAPLPEAEATAEAVIETARQWARRGQRVRGRVVRVRPGEAGHRIVREAIDARTEAIVMPMPRRRPSGKLLSPTLSVVLAKRPARVIIDSAPAYPLTAKQEQAAGLARA